MTYWWQRYTNTPDNNDNPPPDGAPENHFPDQVNNIQRQAMAAIAEIGSLVLGPATAGDPPETAPTINGAFLKLNYDAILPINTIMAWDSNQGVDAFPVPDFPEFSGVLWEQCDATGSPGTPDFQDAIVAGAHSAAGPDQTFTGDATAAEDTGLAGAVSQTGRETDDHVLALTEIPAHDHDFNDPGHSHQFNESKNQLGVAGNTNVVNDVGTGTGVVVTTEGTGITLNPAGGGLGHKHGAPDITIADHQHTSGKPASVALELYKRTA